MKVLAYNQLPVGFDNGMYTPDSDFDVSMVNGSKVPFTVLNGPEYLVK